MKNRQRGFISVISGDSPERVKRMRAAHKLTSELRVCQHQQLSNAQSYLCFFYIPIQSSSRLSQRRVRCLLLPDTPVGRIRKILRESSAPTRLCHWAVNFSSNQGAQWSCSHPLTAPHRYSELCRCGRSKLSVWMKVALKKQRKRQEMTHVLIID